jgi:hypothetical protein
MNGPAVFVVVELYPNCLGILEYQTKLLDQRLNYLAQFGLAEDVSLASKSQESFDQCDISRQNVCIYS